MLETSAAEGSVSLEEKRPQPRGAQRAGNTAPPHLGPRWRRGRTLRANLPPPRRLRKNPPGPGRGQAGDRLAAPALQRRKLPRAGKRRAPPRLAGCQAGRRERRGSGGVGRLSLCGACGPAPRRAGPGAPPSGPAGLRLGTGYGERLIQDGARRPPPPPPRAPPFCLLLHTLSEPPLAGPGAWHRPRPPPPGPATSPLRSRPPPAAVPAVQGRPGRAENAGPSPAARSGAEALARPTCGLLGACAAACCGQGKARAGPGGGARSRAAYRAGGGRRRSARRGLSQRDWAERGGGCGGAGGREGREGPSSELSGSGQAPRAGPAVSTSRHCPRETQEKAEGSAPPPLPAASGQPPAGAGACAGRGAGKGGGGGGGGGGGDGRGRRGAARRRSAPRGSSCRRLRRCSAAKRRSGLCVRPRSGAAVPGTPTRPGPSILEPPPP